MRTIFSFLMLWLSLNGTTQVTKVEAESYSSMSGIKTQPTTDTLGGLNVGWIENGDFTEYQISVPVSGVYDFTVRVASPNIPSDSSYIEILSNGKPIGFVKPVKTAGYQSWSSISTSVKFSAGKQALRLLYHTAIAGAYNINWFTYQPYQIQTVAAVSFDTLRNYALLKNIDTISKNLLTLQKTQNATNIELLLQVKSLTDTLSAYKAKMKAMEDTLIKMPELVMLGFNGKGITSSPFVNGPLKVTKTQRLLLKEPWLMVIQTDQSDQGVWLDMPVTGWKKIF